MFTCAILGPRFLDRTRRRFAERLWSAVAQIFGPALEPATGPEGDHRAVQFRLFRRLGECTELKDKYLQHRKLTILLCKGK